MGLLIDGSWHDRWYDTKSTQGRFIRTEAQFRNWITKDGAPGPSGKGGFEAASGRYHLYVSHACPWAHRTIIMRALKGLTTHISVSVVNWVMRESGWTFEPGPGVVGDPVADVVNLHEIYCRADRKYTGRVTVPLLWDKQTDQPVSNESSEIILMFNDAFNELTGNRDDYYPEDLKAEIEQINDYVYDRINNGVYKTGFATKQSVYEEQVERLFEGLDHLELRLSERRYLVGDRLTLADWRLFTTLIRFDPVYVGHFKCNLKRLIDYPNLWAYTRELYQMSGIADTVHMDHIKGHYYQSHDTLNPTFVVPAGPQIDLLEPHGRELV